jgi:hypothetical protein
MNKEKKAKTKEVVKGTVHRREVIQCLHVRMQRTRMK